MQTVVFTDLDDSLFSSSRRRAPEGLWPVAARLKDGSAICFQSPQESALFAMLSENAIVVPVTARNQDAFSRVDLRFYGDAVLNYGGTIINSKGAVDRHWQERMHVLSRDDGPMLEAIVACLQVKAQAAGIEVTVRAIGEEGHPFYVVMKATSHDAETVRRLAEVGTVCWTDLEAGTGLQLHINGNNVAVMPAWLNKAKAVGHLLEGYRSMWGEVMSIGLGDSLIDRDFMLACDFWMTPRCSQISANAGGSVR